MLLDTDLHFLRDFNCPIALFDVDGVTLDNSHRLHHITHIAEDGTQQPRPDADWEAFHAASDDDAPGAGIHLIEALLNTHNVVFLTARVAFGDQRQRLIDQLYKVCPKLKNYGAIRLAMQEPTTEDWRPAAGCARTNSINKHADYKRDVVLYMKEWGLNPTIGVDDSLVICKMYRDEGLLSLRVHNHVADEAMLR